MIHDLGDHYYMDEVYGFFYDPSDLEGNDDVVYYNTIQECRDDVEAAEESYSIQYHEMRWEYLCSW